MNVTVSKDLIIINAAAFLRSFTFGLTGVVLGIYLFRAGLSSFNIGIVVAAGLAGIGSAGRFCHVDTSETAPHRIGTESGDNQSNRNTTPRR